MDICTAKLQMCCLLCLPVCLPVDSLWPRHSIACPSTLHDSEPPSRLLWSFVRAIGTDHCCVSLVSTRKQARWSIRFFSLFTVDDEGYVQQTNKQNLTLNSNEDKMPCVATIYIQTEERSGKGNNQNVPEQLDLESSFTLKIYSDYACLKVGRETLRTIDRFLEQSRSVQSIYSTYSLQQSRCHMACCWLRRIFV